MEIADIFSTETENRTLESSFTTDKVDLPKTAESPPKTDREPKTRLQREAERQRQTQQKYIEGIREQSEARRRAGELRKKILIGVRSGENIADLFLTASECISLMTGDNTFYRQIEADIKTIYGDISKDKNVLQIQLKETEKRLKRIEDSIEAEQDIIRKNVLMDSARRHRSKIEEIRDSLL